MGEHGVSLENMGNMENMEPGKPTTVFFLHTFNFKAFIATVEKIITYARLENMILGQLRIGERQMTSAALVLMMKKSW